MKISMIRLKWAFVIGTGLFWALACRHPATKVPTRSPLNPPQGIFSDDWLEIHLMGGKVGYGHATMTRDGDRIRSHVDMTLKIVRAEVRVEMQIRQTTVETVEGRPVSFETETRLANQPTLMKGVVNGDKVDITSSQFGMERKQSFLLDPEATMVWGAQRALLKRGLKPGTEFSLKVYSPDLRLDAPIRATFKVGQEEEYTHNGRTQRGIRVAQVLEPPSGPMELVTWMDEAGRAHKAVMNVAGMTMEMFTVDQATAMADFVPKELFMATVIPAGRSIEPDKAERITYRLRLTEAGKAMPEMPATGMQTPRRLDDGSVELVVKRQDHDAIAKAAGTAPASSPGEEYTSGNIIINTDDPELIKLAERAAGDAKAPVELADRLRRFVTDYINDKSLSIGFATAGEVCRSKEGDCSEHAVLLAALGRIKGLPSRVVIGLAYVPAFAGREDIFGFHMWTQFWIGGQWVDFDAALRESRCSPTRIAFAVNSLRDTGLVDLSFALMEVIGRLDVQVVEVK